MLRVQPELVRQRPVSNLTGPTIRTSRFRGFINLLAVLGDHFDLVTMALRRRRELQTAVFVLSVVPAGERQDPRSGVFAALGAIDGIVGPVLARAKQRLRN